MAHPDSMPHVRNCSQPEAITLAMEMMLWLHAIVMVMSFFVEVALFGQNGIVIGMGMIFVMLAMIGCLVLPAAYAIGWLAHRLFSQTTIPVKMAVRALATLFEFNLFAWMLMLSIWHSPVGVF